MGCTNAKPSQPAGNRAGTKPRRASQSGDLNDTRKSKGSAHADPTPRGLSGSMKKRSSHSMKNNLTVPGTARGGRQNFRADPTDYHGIRISMNEVIGIDQQSPKPRFCGSPQMDVATLATEPMIDDVTVPLASSSNPLSTPQVEIAVSLGMDPKTEVHLAYIIKQFANLPPPLGYERIKTRHDELLYRHSEDHSKREFSTSEKHPLFGHYRHVLHDLRDNQLDMSGAKSPLQKRELDFTTFSQPARFSVTAGKEGIKKKSPDFNADFQKAWEQLTLQPTNMHQRETALKEVIADFEKAAMEAAVDHVHESYHTTRNGQVRRGNLLLQYQNSEDNIRLYGSRDVACKMCRHEFTGYQCIRSANILQLHAPLHCTVCYLGNRIDVIAAIPINVQHGLILGPKDQAQRGKRELVSNIGIESIMSIVASDLRLRPHRSASMNQVTCGAELTEAYNGSDGRNYVTGASRLLPCVPTLQLDCKAFRSELVTNYRKNINPTTFSLMNKDEIQHDLERFLYEEVIPKFCNWFVSDESMQLLAEGKEKVNEVFHFFGIPMRSLKDVCDTLIRNHSNSQHIFRRVDQLCTEMVARSLKVLLRNTDSSSSSEVFQYFIDQPIEYVAPLCIKKFNWDPINDSLGYTIKEPDKVLDTLGTMIESRISRTVDNSAARFSLSIELNETVLRAKPKFHADTHVYTHACGYQRLRPELLRKIRRDQVNSRGLNSDGLSAEGLEGDIKEDMALTDGLIVDSLMRDVIPQYASNLLRKPPLDGDHLCETMHAKGINLRYLGTVLAHLLEWSDDGDWSTVRNEQTKVPLAVDIVTAEIFARTFSSYLDDHLHGRNYAESTMIAKAAFQAVIDNPNFLSRKIKAKFGGPKKYTLPTAEKILRRCSELCSATIVMATESRVAEVELKPTIKGIDIPTHLQCGYLDNDDEIDVSDFPLIESILQDYISGRQTPPETALPMLALLSLLYQRWESESCGVRQSELLDCRNKMVQLTDPSSIAHADANILLGSYYRSLKELRQAANYYYRSYSILQKKIDAGESVEGTANVVFIEIDSTMAEYNQQQGKFEEAISHYTRAIEKTEQELGPDDESLGRLYEQRARTACSLCRYDESARDFNRALEIVKISHGVDAPEIADIAICLGQIYSHKARWDLAKKNFECAYSIFRDTYGKHSDSAVMVLTEMLAPTYKKIGLMSQFHKCTLEQLTMEHTDASEVVAKKYFEIAVAYEHEHKKEQAVKYFQLALLSHRKAYGPDHKYTLKCEEWLRVLDKDPAEVPVVQPRLSPRLVLGSTGSIAVPKLALQRNQEEAIGEAPKLKPNLSSRGGTGLSARNMQGAWNTKTTTPQPRPLAVQHLNSSIPPPSHSQLSQHANASTSGGNFNNTLNNTVTSSFNNTLTSTYGSPPQNYGHRDGDIHESPGGSPNFYKQEPRTIGSILRRAGMGELSSIPMTMDESASDSSSDWTSDV